MCHDFFLSSFLGEKPFKCMQCHQTFTQKSSLEKHARIHARRSGHLACLLCGLLFKEKEALTEHAQEMHKGNNFQCGTCGKMYTEERYLILHEVRTVFNSFSISFFFFFNLDCWFPSYSLVVVGSGLIVVIRRISSFPLLCELALL